MSAADALYDELERRLGRPLPSTEEVDRALAPIDRAIAAGASDDELRELLRELAALGKGADEEEPDGEPES